MNRMKSIIFALGLIAAPALAQTAAPVATSPAPIVVAPVAPPPVAAKPVVAAPEAAKPAATKIGTSNADTGVGQPIEGKIGLQPQVTDLGQRAANMHDYILVPMMFIISLLVLGLMFWVSAVYRRKANPIPSKTSHNTFIEILWTLLPVLVLVGIAIPSISLLAAQFKPPSDIKDAKGNVIAKVVTLKATGNQWYWVHNYPDLGVEVTSNLLTKDEAATKGEPYLLGVDNRIVLPIDTPIRLLTTGNDVIHAWAVPAFWIKLDAVPGRINETSFTVNKKGVYYGQCSELCGIKHGFMPIAVEVVSKEDFATWIRAKGGKMPGDEVAVAAPAAGAAAATPPVVTPIAAPAAASK
jgi:cytochrome c oxidase subunit II